MGPGDGRGSTGRRERVSALYRGRRKAEGDEGWSEGTEEKAGPKSTAICLRGCGIARPGEESQVVKRAAGFGGFRRRY